MRRRIAPLAFALALACSGMAAAQTSTNPGSQMPATTPQANPGAAGQAGGSSAQGQGAAPSSSQVDETIAWLTESVNLTPDQQQKLRPILQGEVTQMTAVSQDGSLSPDQKQQKMIDIRRSAGPQIQAILTPQQQQKLAEMRAAQGGARPQQ